MLADWRMLAFLPPTAGSDPVALLFLTFDDHRGSVGVADNAQHWTENTQKVALITSQMENPRRQGVEARGTGEHLLRGCKAAGSDALGGWIWWQTSETVLALPG